MSNTTNDTMTDTSAHTAVKKHPIRGLLWGLMFGLGLTLLLVVTKVISLDLVTMIIVLVAGTLVGVLWSMFGPARAVKGPPPAHLVHRAPPPVSRFDDFDDQPATEVAPGADTQAVAGSVEDAVTDAGAADPGDAEPA